MASYIADLAAYLTSHGFVGGATGWPIYTHYQPEASDRGAQIPGRAVTLYGTSGQAPVDRSELLYSGLQVRVRVERGGEEIALAKCGALRDALRAIAVQTVGTTRVRWITADHSEPLPLGPDSSNRPEFTHNFTIARGG